MQGTLGTKILIVDDSRTARAIVRRAFENYDTEVLEASNGREGLQMARKEVPDLIILDVVMPIMDGISMLRKIKEDPFLRNTPVIMLTVESERDRVVQISRLGVNDYMIKPFSEELLIEKTQRLVPVKMSEGVVTKKKNLSDKCEILITEDKAAIVESIEKGLAHMPWEIHQVPSPDEAIEFCDSKVPDIILMSLSFDNDAAFDCIKELKKNKQTSKIPVFGLCVKTAHDLQKRAQQEGAAGVVTKPIDIEELELRITKALNLDTTQRYFSLDNNSLIITLPKQVNETVLEDIGSVLKVKVHEAVDSGYTSSIVDANQLEYLTIDVVKMLLEIQQVCEQHDLLFKVVGNTEIASNAKDFEESQDWFFFDSLAEAIRA